MTRERWQRIADIFHAAQDRQGDERAAFVRRAAASSELRREVESLLAADQEPMVLDHPIGATAHAVLVDNAAVDPGTFLGHYRIDSLLGAGGYLQPGGRMTAAAITRPADGMPLVSSIATLFERRDLVRPGASFRQQLVVAMDGRRFLLSSLVDEPTTTPVTVILNWRPGNGAATRP